MSKYALPCFKCGRILENVNDDLDIDNQPYAGTAFETHGHYGSTYFDPMFANRWLEINICDACLHQNDHLIRQFKKSEEVWNLLCRKPSS